MVEIGTVLEEETCDSIELWLDGKSKRNNVHTIHWVINDMGTWGFQLYNLDTQKTKRISRAEMNYYLHEGWYKISKEVA